MWAGAGKYSTAVACDVLSRWHSWHFLRQGRKSDDSHYSIPVEGEWAFTVPFILWPLHLWRRRLGLVYYRCSWRKFGNCIWHVKCGLSIVIDDGKGDDRARWYLQHLLFILRSLFHCAIERDPGRLCPGNFDTLMGGDGGRQNYIDIPAGRHCCYYSLPIPRLLLAFSGHWWNRAAFSTITSIWWLPGGRLFREELGKKKKFDIHIVMFRDIFSTGIPFWPLGCPIGVFLLLNHWPWYWSDDSDIACEWCEARHGIMWEAEPSQTPNEPIWPSCLTYIWCVCVMMETLIPGRRNLLVMMIFLMMTIILLQTDGMIYYYISGEAVSQAGKPVTELSVCILGTGHFCLHFGNFQTLWWLMITAALRERTMLTSDRALVFSSPMCVVGRLLLPCTAILCSGRVGGAVSLPIPDYVYYYQYHVFSIDLSHCPCWLWWYSYFPAWREVWELRLCGMKWWFPGERRKIGRHSQPKTVSLLTCPKHMEEEQGEGRLCDVCLVEARQAFQTGKRMVMVMDGPGGSPSGGSPFY